MTQETDRARLPYPTGSDEPKGWEQLQALAERVAMFIGAPSYTTTQRDGLTSSTLYVGMLIYNSTDDEVQAFTGDPSNPDPSSDWLSIGAGDFLPLSGGTLTGDLELHSYKERRVNRDTTSWDVHFDEQGLVRNASTGSVTVTWEAVPTSDTRVRSVTLVLHGPPSSVTWPSGTRFPGGDPPDIDGETWLTAVATGGTVYVFPVGAAVGS